MNVLVFSPHPDDEAIGLGGTIASHVNSGDTVTVVYVTAGELGRGGEDPEGTMILRLGEAQASCKMLGARYGGHLGYPDGGVFASDDMIRDLAAQMAFYEAHLVYTTHGHEAHGDHRVCAYAVGQAAALVGCPVRYFEVWTALERPTDYVILANDSIYQKFLAIDAHASQMERNQFAAAAEGLAKFRGAMISRLPNTYAEASTTERLDLMPNPKRPRVTILLLTYDRLEYARETLCRVLERTDYSGELSVHIADDGSDEGYRETLRAIAKEYPVVGGRVSSSNSEQRGYGASYNLALQQVHATADIVLPLEDDWRLEKRLDLDPLVDVLIEPSNEIGCIRLGYLGWTQELRGKLTRTHNDQPMIRFEPDSAEPHIFAGHPRLESVSWQRFVGPWPEGLNPGATEWEVAQKPAARVGVAWPLFIKPSGDLFAHIGTIQARKDQQ